MAAVHVKGLLHFETDEEAKEFCDRFSVLDAVDGMLNTVRIKSDNLIFSVNTLHGEKLKKYEEYCASEDLQKKYEHGEIKDKEIGF